MRSRKQLRSGSSRAGRDLDDQLATLAIAQPAVGIAADVAARATGMGIDESNQLQDRLQEAVYEAMSELLGDKPI